MDYTASKNNHIIKRRIAEAVLKRNYLQNRLHSEKMPYSEKAMLMRNIAYINTDIENAQNWLNFCNK